MIADAEPTIDISVNGDLIELRLASSSPRHLRIDRATDLINWERHVEIRWYSGTSPIPIVSGQRDQHFFRLNLPADTTDARPGLTMLNGGTFLMGQEEIADPVHPVTLNAFHLGTTEVTFAEWSEIYVWAVSSERGDAVYSFDNSGTALSTNHPVTNINWYDSIKWLNALSEYESRSPSYFTDASWSIVYRRGRINLINAAVNWNGDGYRLPTESE